MTQSTLGGTSANCIWQKIIKTSAHILLVDDEVSLRFIFRTILELQGYVIDEASDGLEAWEAIQSRNYDLVVTDYNMPRLNGLDLIRRLRGEGKDMPVIFMTGDLTRISLDQIRPLKINLLFDKTRPAHDFIDGVKAAVKRKWPLRLLSKPL